MLQTGVPCDISITNIVTECAGDGFYTIRFTVVNTGDGTNWTGTVAGMPANGTYGITYTSTQIAVGTAPTGASVYQDTQDGGCTATRSVTVPTDCESCRLPLP
ncbi:MAG: hypothetical protein R2795_05530 [Saprospiraceae bacterium]